MSHHDDFLTRALWPQTFQNREQPVHGVVTARVVRIEADGAYRLRFHGMNGQDDDDYSAPARVMMPMAGARRGIHFLPEVGDEVVVGFQVGNTNNPIILGAVWNRDDRPPDQANESPDNHIRTIVSRSGHELTFDDTPGAEKVTLRSNRGHEVVLDDAPGAPGLTVSSAGGRRVVLDDTPPGGISLETLMCRLTLSDAGGEISLNATARISLNAPVIELNGFGVTIGSGAGSSVIDGLPFMLHRHTNTMVDPNPLSTSGPVSPV
jgi:phage baseplate assembly protein gpV